MPETGPTSHSSATVLPGCGATTLTDAGWRVRPGGQQVVLVRCEWHLPAAGYLPEYHAGPLDGGEIRWSTAGPAVTTWGSATPPEIP